MTKDVSIDIITQNSLIHTENQILSSYARCVKRERKDHWGSVMGRELHYGKSEATVTEEDKLKDMGS